jgi:hypothetical protein
MIAISKVTYLDEQKVCQEHKIYLESIQGQQDLSSNASCRLSVPNNEMSSIPLYTL